MKKSIKQMQSSSLRLLIVRFLSNKKLLILQLFILLSTVSVHAYDFMIDGLYYNILSNTEKLCEVTKAPTPYEYTDNISIPSHVNWGGTLFTVSSIGEDAFHYCNYLYSVQIPNSVNTIGSYAFCAAHLTSLDIPNSVTSIGQAAFSYCDWLTSVSLPNSVTSIEKALFSQCGRLTTVDIPNSVNYIGEYAFKDCTSLNSVEIPKSVTFIDNYAFEGCNRLTEIILPNSINHIGFDVFRNTALYDNELNWENGVLYIDNHLIKAKSSDLTGYYAIKDGSLTISNGAFYDCSHLSSILIPSSVTHIGSYAFSGCEKLTTIEIPNSVISIGDNAFYSCLSLKSAKIGNGISSLPSNLFRRCELSEVWVLWGNPDELEIGTDVFNSAENITLYVPVGTIENYMSISPWNEFKEILEYMPGGNQSSEKCSNPSITIEKEKLIFSSSTPDAKFYYWINCNDVCPFTNTDTGVIELSGIYQISVYAYADGYDNSDIVTATLVWVNPQIEGTGIMSMEAKKAVLIKSVGDNIQICGTEFGETILLYSLDGKLLTTTKASDEETIIPFNAHKGEIYIIKYGDKAIKYKY